MRKFLICFLVFVSSLWAAVPVIPTGQSRVVRASVEAGTTVGAPIFASGTPTAWNIVLETNPAVPGLDPNERFFDIDASGQITVSQSLFPFFGNTRTSEAVVLSLQAFNADGNSVAEDITISVASDVPLINPGQSVNTIISAEVGASVGPPIRALNTPTYWSIVDGNTGAAFSIDNEGQLTTNRFLDTITWGSSSDPIPVPLTVIAGNDAGQSNQETVTVYISLSGSSRCGYITPDQTRFASIGTAVGATIGYPVDTHNIDAIWIQDLYVDTPTNVPTFVDPTIVTAFYVEDTDPTTATFGQIRLARPLRQFIDVAHQSDIFKFHITLAGHAIEADCPSTVTEEIILYLLPDDTGNTGPDGGTTTNPDDPDTTTTTSTTDFAQYIDDLALRSCIRSNLGLNAADPITAIKVLELEHLSCFCEGIADLDGLQLFKNILFLDLSNNLISDPRRISGLMALIDLKLAGNLITDLETNHPLSSLVNLERLDLSHNQIVSTTAFANLINLSYISLDNNRLTNIASLSGNGGIGTGDTIILDNNCLSSQAALSQIGIIQARTPNFLTYASQTGAQCVGAPIVQLPLWPEPSVLEFADTLNQRAACSQ